MTTKLETGTEQLPPAWIFLPGLAVAVGVLKITFLVPSSAVILRYRMAYFGLAAVCLSGIAASLARRKIAVILAAVILTLYWAILGAVSFVVLLSPIFVLLYYGVFIIPAFLIVGFCTARARRGLSHTWTRASVVGGLVLGLVTMGVRSAPALAKSAEQTAPWTHPTEPLVLGEDMVTLVKCSHRFASLHPESGYPESLNQMGPAGTGCLPEALLAGKDKGFSLAYHPGTRDAKGKIGAFTINAEQASPHGPDFSTMSTDESGLILYRYEGPHGKGIPYSYSPAESAIETVLGCMWNASAQSMWNDLHADQGVPKCLGDQYVLTKGTSGVVGAYTFAYTFEHKDSGAIEGFIGKIRPRTYGIGGIRSYFFVGSYNVTKSADGPASVATRLRVYATPEDRPATYSDPLANTCEIHWVACMGPAQIN
jgi:hypothetical protein